MDIWGFLYINLYIPHPVYSNSHLCKDNLRLFKTVLQLVDFDKILDINNVSYVFQLTRSVKSIYVVYLLRYEYLLYTVWGQKFNWTIKFWYRFPTTFIIPLLSKCKFSYKKKIYNYPLLD